MSRNAVPIAIARKPRPASISTFADSISQVRWDWWNSTRCAADGAIRHAAESVAATSVM